MANTPRSISEAAADQQSNVIDGPQSFAADFQSAIDGSAALNESRERLAGAVERGNDLLTATDTFLSTELGMDPDAITQRRATIATERDKALKDQDLAPVRSFYSQVTEYLENLTDGDGKLTQFTFAGKVSEFLRNSDSAMIAKADGSEVKLHEYVVDKFGTDITAALNGEDMAAAFALRAKIADGILADAEITDEAKVEIETALLPITMAVRNFLGLKDVLIQLPKDAIYGMIGRVPKEPKMTAVYNNAEQIATFAKTYSVQVDVGGKIHELYVSGSAPKTVEPSAVYDAIKDQCGGDIQDHIVGVHIRRDEDVTKLLKAMDGAQSLQAKLRDGGAQIAIFGKDDSEEITVQGTLPGGVTEADIIAEPMKHLAHNFQFFRNDQPEDAQAS